MNDQPPLEDDESDESLDFTLDSLGAEVNAFGTEECRDAQVGSCRLVELIGEGAHGKVWLAEQSEPIVRKVAAKIIKEAISDHEVLQRFKAECNALGSMGHSSFPKVFEIGTTEITKRPFVIMEFIPGISLTNYCDTHLLDIRQRLRLFSEVCHAVDSAHQSGYIHRDLKPSNILVSDQDQGQQVHIIDFGISQAIHDSIGKETHHTALSTVLGSWPYMSPEQAGTSKLGTDMRTDVYSLGIILYELLAGTPPCPEESFSGLSIIQKCALVSEKEPPSLINRLQSYSGDQRSKLIEQRKSSKKDLEREFRNDLWAITLKCLEKDRNRRYRHTTEIAADVQNWLNNKPVTAQQQRTPYLLRKFIARHKKTVITGAAFFLLMLAAAIFSNYFRLLALDQKKIAEKEKLIAVQHQEKSEELLDYLMGDLTRTTIKSGNTQRLERVLERVKKYYDGINTATFTPQQLRRKAWTSIYAGDIARSTGRLDEAIAPYSDAILELQQALETDKNNHTIRRDVAVVWNYLGVVHSGKGQYEATQDAFNNSHELLKKLATEEPENTDTLRELSVSLNGLGRIAAINKRYSDAREHFQKSLSLRRGLTKIDEENYLWQMDLGSSLLLLADTEIKDGAKEVALSSAKQAVEVFEKLAKKHTENLEIQNRLASAFLKFGVISLKCGRNDAALSLLEKARAKRKKLFNKDPKNLSRQYELAIADTLLADVFRVSGKHREAKNHYSTAEKSMIALTAIEPKNRLWKKVLNKIRSKFSKLPPSSQ